INFGCKKSNNFFKKKLKNSKYYFEYGSGSSTLYADLNEKKFTSIELDKSFFFMIKNKLKKKNVFFINLGPVGEFSYPLFKNKKKIVEYIKSINPYFNKKIYPDFVLIDGRFRVACCLNLLLIINKKKIKTTIIIDDYKKRSYYKILKNFFYVNQVGRMAVLKAKKKLIHPNIFNKYILDSR
ncbi:hypothetical protein OAB10_01760, partial [Candidatus Pelagibacter sp.]|nr:hypothetical protein [Candidatus Pelagibacter sp.]